MKCVMSLHSPHREGEVAAYRSSYSDSFPLGGERRGRGAPEPIKAITPTLANSALAPAGSWKLQTEIERSRLPPNALIGGPVEHPPRFPLNTCGNDGLGFNIKLSVADGTQRAGCGAQMAWTKPSSSRPCLAEKRTSGAISDGRYAKCRRSRLSPMRNLNSRRQRRS